MRADGFEPPQLPAATNDSDWVSVNSADELVNKPADDEVVPEMGKINDSIGNLIKFKDQSEKIQRKFNQIIKDSINLHSEIINDNDSSEEEDSYGEESDPDDFQAPASKLNLILNPVIDGSIAFGLPTLAVTRRTAQTQHRLHQIESVNKKLCRIMQVPGEYVQINHDELLTNAKHK